MLWRDYVQSLDPRPISPSCAVDALGPRTKLVTITVGGNDVSYIGNLLASSCISQPHVVPLIARLLGSCRLTKNDDVEQAFDGLPIQLTRLVDEIRRRSPRARIIFVAYTTVLPKTTGCEQLLLSTRDLEAYRDVAFRLAVVTAFTAWKTHTELLQASVATESRRLCSPRPFVNGLAFPRSFLLFGPVPFHPKEEAARAIADALLHEWRSTTEQGF